MREKGGPASEREDGQPDSVQAESGAQLPLIPLSLPQVLRLVWALLWRWVPSLSQVLAWSRFRRRHQAAARYYHYRRRLAARAA